MEKEDIILLIESGDFLNKMNLLFEQLTGQGYENGDFARLDNIFKVLLHNAHPFHFQSEERKELLIETLMNSEITAENRAEILLNGIDFVIADQFFD